MLESSAHKKTKNNWNKVYKIAVKTMLDEKSLFLFVFDLYIDELTKCLKACTAGCRISEAFCMPMILWSSVFSSSSWYVVYGLYGHNNGNSWFAEEVICKLLSKKLSKNDVDVCDKVKSKQCMLNTQANMLVHWFKLLVCQ